MLRPDFINYDVRMKELFILFFCATIAFLLGNGYYKSFRSGVLTIKRRA